MKAYALRDVRFSFGGDFTLRVEEMEIEAGRVVALVGPNGSGKTTLLHLLAFLQLPDCGGIRFFGEPATRDGLLALRRRATLLLQNPYLFGGTVRENVEWGLRIQGIAAAERHRRSGEALERTGLQDLASRPARRLSGGEAQRAALARVLVLEPEVLLLDEPVSHLDAGSRTRVEEVVKEWNSDRGTTVVLATHDINQAYRLGAEVWQVERGTPRRGEPDNVYRGSMVPGEPGTFDTGRMRLYIHPHPERATFAHIGPKEVILSSRAQPSSARNQMEGRIVSAEMLGNGEVLVTLDVGEPMVVLITETSWERLGLSVGGTAVASFKATAVRAG